MNRMNIKDKDKIIPYSYNGSCLAVGRTIVSIIENNYKNGYIYIPSVLIPYTKFDKIKINKRIK